MMGQELFEHPKKQYKTYGITALEELSPVSYTHLTLPTSDLV